MLRKVILVFVLLGPIFGLGLVIGLGAQDKKPDDACAALRLENAQLRGQLADLKMQFIQAQGEIMRREFERAQEEKTKAQAELDKLQPKQAAEKKP